MRSFVIRKDLSGQHAIVTGGSSGIGFSVARLLALDGMNVSLIARGQERLKAAIASLESARTDPNQRFFMAAADVGDHLQIEESINAAINHLGFPTILVTSAGTAPTDYFERLPREAFEEAMRVNYFGTLYSVRAVVPVMRSKNRGRIVLVSSGAGLVGFFGYSAYSPSKFALRGLAEAMRGELRSHGITVSIAYPPDTNTPMLVEYDRTAPPETKRIGSSAAIWEPDDVARAILRGLHSGRFSITPGWEMTCLNRFMGPISPLLAYYFDRLAARVQRQIARGHRLPVSR